MSADLFAAFGFDKPPEQTSKSAITFIPPSKSADTWQPWPTISRDERVSDSRFGDSLWRRDDSGNEVLFDASIDDDFGDFGDFETPVTLATVNPPIEDLLNHNEIDKPHSPTQPSIPQLSTGPSSDLLDDWADFKDEPAESQAVKIPARANSRPDMRERPTNVPPPAVLLAWLPKCYIKLCSDARSNPTDTTVHDRTRQTFYASAHLIAGRSQRWKRDTRLAQSMKIAAAGRPGAMKLTSVDKSEMRKEDQEVEEVVAAWSRAWPVLNAIMTKSDSVRSITPLRTKMPVNTATGPDVLTADVPCALCGLKRNERVAGVDRNISDLFSEWWIEHWGHHDCQEFWYHFHDVLEHR